MGAQQIERDLGREQGGLLCQSGTGTAQDLKGPEK